MNPIQPSPSQAAVVLKKFLAEHDVKLPLGACQEAVARLNGHASWNELTAHSPARVVRKVNPVAAEATKPAPTCRSCDSALHGDYCSNDKCRHYDWPQWVDSEDVKVFSPEELEDMYHVKERQSPDDTVAKLLDKNGTVIPQS